MIDRWGRFRQFPLPTPSPALLASALRWLMLVVFVAGVGWLIELRRRRRTLLDLRGARLEPSDLAERPPLG
jgi:hypothetical protein